MGHSTEKGEVFFPPALSGAPQDLTPLEREFTIKPSALFAHIIPTIIL